MKKALIFTTLLATACVVDAANTAASADITLDTRTQGAAVLAGEAEVDVRGLTVDLSTDISLDTRIPLGTMFIVR